MMTSKPAESPIEQLSRLFAQMQRDPLLFVRRVLKVEPTPQQKLILEAIAPSGAHVSVRSGTTTGKSTAAAWIVLWMLSFYDDVKIGCTAPSSAQLFDVLWSEISKWHWRMIPELRERLTVHADRVVLNGREKLCFASARTSRPDQPESFQGLHAKNMMFILEEASGIADKVFEVSEGSLSTRGARVLMLGNPTRLGGYFHNSHTKDRASWTTIHLSSLDSPLAAPGYAERIAKRFGGLDSNVYRVRVLGEFPKENPDQLILLEWLTAAVGREMAPFDGQQRIAGLDVARYGDDLNALVIRQGGKIIHIEQWGGVDTMFTTGKVVDAWRNKKLFDVLRVDVIGVGAGVADRLTEIGVPTTSVNVAESSALSDRFERLRDELWWSARERFREALISIDQKLELRDDLVGELSTVTYKLLSSGKLKVESKDELKKRGIASPNIADALCLTFCEGLPTRNSKADRRQVEYTSDFVF